MRTDCSETKLHLNQRVAQTGRTLIELMIAITIGLVMLVAILAVYSGTSSTARQSEAGARMNEDATIAMNYIGNYIRMAGFTIPQVNQTESVVTFGGGTTKLCSSSFCGAVIRGCDNGFTNVTSASSTGSAFSLRFQGDVFNTVPVTTSSLPSDCLNNGIRVSATSSFATGPTYTLVESRFYVTQTAAIQTPELHCAGNGGTPTLFIGQPIMQYVERMVFTYGVAADASSRDAITYLTAAQIDALSAAGVDSNWGRVLSVKVCLQMRSELPDQNGAGTYINCAGTATASTDGLLRRAFTSVVTIRNRGGFSTL
jgi:type IV pilus assembly protein PilW